MWAGTRKFVQYGIQMLSDYDGTTNKYLDPNTRQIIWVEF
jgi:hypothetical protein